MVIIYSVKISAQGDSCRYHIFGVKSIENIPIPVAMIYIVILNMPITLLYLVHITKYISAITLSTINQNDFVENDLSAPISRLIKCFHSPKHKNIQLSGGSRGGGGGGV